MILALRTDKPEAEMYLYDHGKVMVSVTWQAHRELSMTLLGKLEELLAQAQIQVGDLSGIVAYQGPGSFTGLRIGVAVANTLAYTLNLPIVGATGEGWTSQGMTKLTKNPAYQPIIPLYGAQPNITQPRK